MIKCPFQNKNMCVLKPWIRADNFQTNYDFIEHQRMQVKNYVKTGFIEETNKTVNHPVNFGDKISIKRLPFDNCIKFPDFFPYHHSRCGPNPKGTGRARRWTPKAERKPCRARRWIPKAERKTSSKTKPLVSHFETIPETVENL